MNVYLLAQVSPLLLAIGCAAAPQKPEAEAPPPPKATPVSVERVEPAAQAAAAESDRLGLQVLVVPDGAMLRDRRHLRLGKGSLRVSVRGVPADLEPASVALRTATQGAQLELAEARLYSGQVTPQLLLTPFVGKEVTAYVIDDATQAEQGRKALLIGLHEGLPVVSIDGRVRVLEVGRVAVPRLPDSLRDEPTLDLVVTSDREEQDVELVYKTHKVDADAVYQLVRTPGSPTAQLTGLVALTNDSSTTLHDARFTLSHDNVETAEFAQGDADAKAQKADEQTSPPTTLLRLSSPVSLTPGQRAMVRLFGPTDVTLARKVIVEGPGLPSYATTPEEVSNGSIRSVLDASTAGAPLSPSGMVAGLAHLFERSASDPPRGYGSAAARPLPGAKGVRVDLGPATRYPSRRRLTARKDLGRCVVESSWEVTVSNTTEDPVPIEDVEPVVGKYEIIESSLPVQAREVDHFVFGMNVPAMGEAKLKFKVRTTTCVRRQRAYWGWSKSGFDSSGYYGKSGKK